MKRQKSVFRHPREILPVLQARTRLFARILLVAVSFAVAGVAEARSGASGSATTTKTATSSAKKRHRATPATKSATSRYTSQTARNRRARLARAKAAARARQWRDVSEPRFKTNDQGEVVPDIRAEAAIIYNPETHQVLWEENSQDSRSIASITKVMTAEVLLESNPDLTREVVIERSDVSRLPQRPCESGFAPRPGANSPSNEESLCTHRARRWPRPDCFSSCLLHAPSRRSCPPSRVVAQRCLQFREARASPSAQDRKQSSFSTQLQQHGTDWETRASRKTSRRSAR